MVAYKKIILLSSTSGSNAQNIIQYVQKNFTHILVAAVCCDQPEAYVLKRCQPYGVPTHLIEFKEEKEIPYQERKQEHESRLKEIIDSYQVDLIILVGYMRILSSEFISYYTKQGSVDSCIINIHPSLLPAFPGKEANEKAFAAGVTTHGVTIHHVDSGIDTGKIIMQRSFKKEKEDSFEEFLRKGKLAEHLLFRHFFDEYASWNLECVGERV